MTHHGGPYRVRTSTYWWAHRWSYLKFILRELSSVPVAWAVLITLLQLRALSGGAAAWAEFQGWLRNPLAVVVNLACLAAIVFHAITWFNLAPAAIVLRVGGKRVPGSLIAVSNYAAWVAASALVAWFILRG